MKSWPGPAGSTRSFSRRSICTGMSHPLAELLREQQPDVIHIHHVMTLGVEIIGLIRRCLPRARIVMTLHDYYAICANDGQMVTQSGALCHAARPDACRSCFPERSLTDFKLRDIHIGHALDQVDHFIAPSRFLRDRFIAAGLSPDRISVVPNGFPAVEPTPARRDLRRDRFAFFGHINRFKGATVALEASALLSEQGVTHALSLYGGTDHQTEQTLTKFATARAKAPDGAYRGSYRRAEIPRLIAGADWVVFPSEWWENAPLVINEAFQHWRPVICSAIGGALELVRDGVNGLHFPVGDGRGTRDHHAPCDRRARAVAAFGRRDRGGPSQSTTRQPGISICIARCCPPRSDRWQHERDAASTRETRSGLGGVRACGGDVARAAWRADAPRSQFRSGGEEWIGAARDVRRCCWHFSRGVLAVTG